LITGGEILTIFFDAEFEKNSNVFFQIKFFLGFHDLCEFKKNTKWRIVFEGMKTTFLIEIE
jgi:hypothetical protein